MVKQRSATEKQRRRVKELLSSMEERGFNTPDIDVDGMSYQKLRTITPLKLYAMSTYTLPSGKEISGRQGRTYEQRLAGIKGSSKVREDTISSFIEDYGITTAINSGVESLIIGGISGDYTPDYEDVTIEENDYSEWTRDEFLDSIDEWLSQFREHPNVSQNLFNKIEDFVDRLIKENGELRAVEILENMSQDKIFDILTVDYTPDNPMELEVILMEEIS